MRSMVKKGGGSLGGIGKSSILVRCINKKQSDNNNGGEMMIKKKKKKKKKNVGEMLKSIRFMLKRCSNYINKNKELKRKKSSSNISTDDDAISEAKLLLCQLEEKADEPLKSRKRKKRKQQPRFDKDNDDLNNIIRVKQGDRIDIIPLLFPKHRNYLLKSNSNQLVKAEDLQGKLIVLVFANLYDSTWIQDSFCLIDVYNQIHHKAPFEVVFVPLTLPNDHKQDPHFDPHHSFARIFSCMPWTAVPYSDVISWQRLQATFGFDETVFPDIPLIDPTGLILAVYGQSLFSSFGARGYPYTDQRIKFLRAEERTLLKHPSIYNLLTSSEREYVISNDGRQVPILSLEDKVVALHFLEEGHSIQGRNHDFFFPNSSYDDLTVQLMTTYERLKDKNFEVVLIYIHDSWNTQGCTNEDTFWKTFKAMPWLALPFKDPVIKKLRRICNYPLDLEGPAPNPGLVIVGPRGEFFEPYGADILMNFGIQAFPFTRRRMVELEAERAKKLKPVMIWDPDTLLIRNAESEIPFSQVAGKRIILLIGKRCHEVEALTILKSEYNRRKGTDEEFEVIQIFNSEVLSDDIEHVKVPWLVQLFDEGSPHLLKLLRDAFGNAELVAFDHHGHVVRKANYLDIEGGDDSKFPFYAGKEDPKFPFYAGGLEKEIYSDLYTLFGWMYWHKDDISQF